ncbi:MAG: hypothetical protein IKN96_05520 [Oscillibacter sp.]|nr:hypothetical protein [Oscillibacter sp.]
MAAEKAARRKSGAPQLVIARGVLLALVLWACGAGLLAALMTAGLVGDAGAFPALCGATAFASFAGAFGAARQTPWNPLAASGLTAALFASLLLCVGLLTWGRVSWAGRGGTLALWALSGGAVAGIFGRPRPKKRRRAW